MLFFSSGLWLEAALLPPSVSPATCVRTGASTTQVTSALTPLTTEWTATVSYPFTFSLTVSNNSPIWGSEHLWTLILAEGMQTIWCVIHFYLCVSCFVFLEPGPGFPLYTLMDSKGSGADSYNPNTLLNDSLRSHGILLKDKATVFEGGQIRRTQ